MSDLNRDLRPGLTASSERGAVVVLGSANLDFVTRLPHIPAPGETVLGGDYATLPGGKGANQAVACARAGADVTFVGALGHDPSADALRAALATAGVRDRSRTVQAPTGAAFVSVAQSGENAIAVASGANAHVKAADLNSLQLDGVAWLLLQLEIPLPEVTAAARLARAAGVRVALNAAPAAVDGLPDALLSGVDLLIVNAGELAALSGEQDVEAGLRAARQLGPRTVLVTLGGGGSRALDGERTIDVPAHPVRVQDTTGAGDTYAGVLLAALAAELPLEQAMRRASVGAALACSVPGAQAGMPTAAKIDAEIDAELRPSP